MYPYGNRQDRSPGRILDVRWTSCLDASAPARPEGSTGGLAVRLRSSLLAVGALVAADIGRHRTDRAAGARLPVVAATAAVSDPPRSPWSTVVAEFTAIGFARRPYADLRGGPLVWHDGLVLLCRRSRRAFPQAAFGPPCRDSEDGADWQVPAAQPQRSRSSSSSGRQLRRRWTRSGSPRLPPCHC